MKRASLEEIVRKKFGIHRGLASKEHPENSLGAIREAFKLAPPFVEFDVMLVNGEIWTGHPPGDLLDKLEEVLPLFEGKRTYPKIDIKLRIGESFPPIIEGVLSALAKVSLDSALVVFSGLKSRVNINREYYMQAERHFAKEAGAGQEKIRLNLDLARYRPAGEEIDEGIEKHVKNLESFVCSLSSEIHEENLERIAQFAQKHKIGQLMIWLRGAPDVPNPKVTEETIRAALALEEKYDLEVYFDINPSFIVGFDILKLGKR